LGLTGALYCAKIIVGYYNYFILLLYIPRFLFLKEIKKMKKRRFLALLLALCMLALPVLTACDGLGDIGDELDDLLGEGSGSDGSGNSTSPKPEDSKPTPELPKPEDSKPTPPDPVGPKPEGPLPGESDDTSDESGKDDEKPKPEDKSEFDEASGLQYTLSPKGDFYTVTAVKPLKATHVVIPKEYKGVPVTTIEKNAFSGCTDLQSIYLPNGLTHISAFAFFKCSSLKTIVIPESVVVIGSYAFDGCESLNIYCEADSQPQKWDKKWNPDNLPVTWGYTCEHSWTEATCTEPSACSVCGAVDGEALGHDIVDGACTRCDYEEETDDDLDIGDPDKVTNISSLAEILCKYDEFYMPSMYEFYPEYITDGKKYTANEVDVEYTPTFTFQWNKEYDFTSIVLFTDYDPALGCEESEIIGRTNTLYDYKILMYNDQGELVYESKRTLAFELYSVEHKVNCTASRMEIILYFTESSTASLWEVEAFAKGDIKIEHKWQNATCTEPSVCSVCGEIKGEALGHDIVDGACTRCDYVEEKDEDKPISGNNIASSAEITLNDNWWAGDPQYLVDGDWSTASLSGIHTRFSTFSFAWDESYYFTSLIFVVNGQGSAPVADIDFSEPTNNSFNFSVTLYNEDGEEIYTVDGLSAEDIETYRLDVNCEAARIDLTIDGKYTYYPIFEVETYAVVDESECIHYWKDATCVSPKTCVKCGETRGELGEHIFDTYVETVSPTCTKEGYDTYVCSFCGIATEERNYVEPLGHSYSNGKCIRCDKIAPSANGNIAPEATPDCSEENWLTDPQYINDGDRTTGSAGSARSRYVTYSLKFNQSRYVSTIILVTNGIGSFPVDSSLIFDTITKNSYNFKVTCLDGLGDTVFSSSLHSINSANGDQEVILELGGIKIKEVRIEIESQWSLNNGLWEVEVYEDKGTACNHSWIDATCTEPKQCRYCGETEGEALGHDTNAFVKTVAPTCVDKGYDIYTCSRCRKASNYINYVVALGHSYDENNVCDVCGYVKCLVGLDDIESLTASHTGGGAANLEKLFDGEKTTTGMYSDGNVEYFPEVVGDYITVVLKTETKLDEIIVWTCGNWTTATLKLFDKNGNLLSTHEIIYNGSFNGGEQSTPVQVALDESTAVKTITLTSTYIKWGSGCTQKTSEIELLISPNEACIHQWQDATCESPKTCITCGLTEGEALDHAMDILVEVVPPTCVDMGYDIYTCSFCHDIIEHFNYVDALGHNYILEDKTVVVPTCTEDGYSYTYCTRCCLEYFFDFVPATGHSFVDGVCLNCGAYDEVLVTYCYLNGSVWETATANRDGTYTLRTAKKSSNGTVTLADGTVVDMEFYGWFDRDGNLYAPGQTVVFKQDTCLYEAYGVTVYNSDDLKRVVSNSYRAQAYVKLGADITVDTTISSNWSIMLIDLNGHTLTSTAKDRAVFVQRGSFALVGEGSFIHQPITTSTSTSSAGVYFQAHGYADADYPQLFRIGKDVTFKTPYSALYVQTVVLDGTPNIYVAGNVNAKALAYINPVTTGALCEIATSANVNLTEDFIVFANTTGEGNYMTVTIKGNLNSPTVNNTSPYENKYSVFFDHEHVFSTTAISSIPTYENSGSAIVECLQCGDRIERDIPALCHHKLDGDVCYLCDVYVVGGVELRLSDDEQSYTVVGVCDLDVIGIFIPYEFNGLPVTSIGDYAFLGLGERLQIDTYSSFYKIYLPTTITSVGDFAFSECDDVTIAIYLENGNSASKDATNEWAESVIVAIGNDQFLDVVLSLRPAFGWNKYLIP